MRKTMYGFSHGKFVLGHKFAKGRCEKTIYGSFFYTAV